MALFYISLLCIFLLLVYLSLRFLFSAKNRSLSGPLPPGKTGWPMVGETLEFLSCGWKGQPENFFYDRMAKYSSVVFRTHILGEKLAVFCGAEGNKFLFSNENKLVHAWWPDSVSKVLRSSTQTSSNEEVMKMRKILPNFLKPESLQRYIGIMDYIAGRHFSSTWENKDRVEVLPLCKNYTFWIATRLFLSFEYPTEFAKLLEPFNILASGIISAPINLPGTPFNRAIKASHQIRKQLLAIIKQRKIDLAAGKASSTQDILSHMLTQSDENGKFMNELDVADKILGLLLGGHDTASSTCALIVKFLAELPEIYEGVYKEQMEIANSKAPGEFLNWDDIQKMKHSWNVACEVLRLAPPAQGGFREAITDFVYNGFFIPKGWKMYWTANTTHKDPKYFPEPENFDPSRFEGSGPAPYTFVPFGGGPRMCPGNEFARMEILVFMHHVVTRFSWEKIIPDEKIVVNPFSMPAKGLPVRLYPHKAKE